MNTNMNGNNISASAFSSSLFLIFDNYEFFKKQLVYYLMRRKCGELPVKNCKPH